MAPTLRIGSRPSALALAQANLVKARLVHAVQDLRIEINLRVEIVPISTSGDKMTSASLARVGGKGLFVRELEQALTDRRIDLAVHSMKDLPAILPAQFRIAAVPEREDPRDVLITRRASGDFEAIILAIAGLKRLGLSGGNLFYCLLDASTFIPSGGQGALAVEALADTTIGGSPELEHAFAALNDPRAFAEVTAERSFLATIGASC